jgi:hypothetical protein
MVLCTIYVASTAWSFLAATDARYSLLLFRVNYYVREHLCWIQYNSAWQQPCLTQTSTFAHANERHGDGQFGRQPAGSVLSMLSDWFFQQFVGFWGP